MNNLAFVIQVQRTGKGCLSYLIGSGRQAAVIDASLAPEVYVGIAKKIGCEISAVLDTHIHADHLSRSRRLAELTGATLYLPHQQRVLYAFQSMRDTETIEIGRAKLQALHTSGHTSESSCYLLDGEALFTGTLSFWPVWVAPTWKPLSVDLRSKAAVPLARWNSIGCLTVGPRVTGGVAAC